MFFGNTPLSRPAKSRACRGVSSSVTARSAAEILEARLATPALSEVEWVVAGIAQFLEARLATPALSEVEWVVAGAAKTIAA